LDGPEKENNNARVFRADKEGTFQKICQGYQMLKDAGCKNPSISLTIGAHNAKNLRKNVEYLVDKFSPSGFGFNFLIGPSSNLNGLDVDMDYVTNQVIETFKFLREKGIFEDRMMRKVKAFVKREPHLKDCGGVGNQLVITADGHAGPCQAFASSKKYFRSIEELEDKDLKKDGIFKEWNSRFPLNMDKCSDCLALGVCGGGCPYHSHLTKGNIFELDERMCNHNKGVLNWLIQEAIDLEHGTKT